MKTTLLAAVLALSLAGCGQDGPSYGARSSQVGAKAPDPGARANNPADLPENAPINAWALRAYAIYGKDAVETCFAAFRSALSDGAVETDARGKPLPYRALLVDFLCECARGQSAEACPVP